MTYAILKNHRGQPEALFEIERATPKRYYGRLADTLQHDSWFWLTGFTKGRHDGESFAVKDIVMCTMPSDGAWHMMKPTFLRIKSAHKEVQQGIASDLNDACETARTAEIENDVDARKAYMREVEKYVADTHML